MHALRAKEGTRWTSILYCTPVFSRIEFGVNWHTHTHVEDICYISIQMSGYLWHDRKFFRRLPIVKVFTPTMPYINTIHYYSQKICKDRNLSVMSFFLLLSTQQTNKESFYGFLILQSTYEYYRTQFMNSTPFTTQISLIINFFKPEVILNTASVNPLMPISPLLSMNFHKLPSTSFLRVLSGHIILCQLSLLPIDPQYSF